jgi:hypothetical protein
LELGGESRGSLGASYFFWRACRPAMKTEGGPFERIIAAMAFLEQYQPPYIFHIRSPRFARAIGLYLLVVFVASSVYIGSKIGLGWFPSNLYQCCSSWQ